eukprot:3903807-Pyramimonas_sp.AAC.1
MIALHVHRVALSVRICPCRSSEEAAEWWGPKPGREGATLPLSFALRTVLSADADDLCPQLFTEDIYVRVEPYLQVGLNTDTPYVRVEPYPQGCASHGECRAGMCVCKEPALRPPDGWGSSNPDEEPMAIEYVGDDCSKPMEMLQCGQLYKSAAISYIRVKSGFFSGARFIRQRSLGPRNFTEE